MSRSTISSHFSILLSLAIFLDLNCVAKIGRNWGLQIEKEIFSPTALRVGKMFVILRHEKRRSASAWINCAFIIKTCRSASAWINYTLFLCIWFLLSVGTPIALYSFVMVWLDFGWFIGGKDRKFWNKKQRNGKKVLH